MINTKDNNWIEGFDNIADYELKYIKLSRPIKDPIIYAGKTSEIPEELAKECVETMPYDITNKLYRNYSGDYWKYNALEAIQSALTKEDGTIYPFCIIFRKDQ